MGGKRRFLREISLYPFIRIEIILWFCNTQFCNTNDYAEEFLSYLARGGIEERAWLNSFIFI